MVSPPVDALDRQITELHTRAAAFRNSISSDVEEYRRKLTQQADELDKGVKNLEETRDKLKAAEEAVDKLPVRQDINP